MAIAGLVLGILGFVFWWFPFLGLVVSVLGIVLSAVSRKKSVNGLSTAGLVIGILATVFSTIMTFTVGVAIVM